MVVLQTAEGSHEEIEELVFPREGIHVPEILLRGDNLSDILRRALAVPPEIA